MSQKKVGNYYLIECIGKGSFSKVFKARNEKTNELYAIKMISLSHFADKNVFNIEGEAELMRKLEHINILKLYETKKSTNNYYMVFEYCSNGDLEFFLRKYCLDEQTKKLNIEEGIAKGIALKILEGFKFLNDNKIVHRDLKLTNILVDGKFEIKIADFGFARYIETNSLMQTYCGTPITMAPEILLNIKYNSKCDIWSFGVIIFQILFDKYPFQPKENNLNQLIKEIQNTPLVFPKEIPVSNEIKSMLVKMLKADFNERINFDELAKEKWFQGPIVNISEIFDQLYKVKHRKIAVFEDIIESESEDDFSQKETQKKFLQQIRNSKTKVYQILLREYEKLSKNIFESFTNCDLAFASYGLDLKEMTYYIYHDLLFITKNFLLSKIKIEFFDNKVYYGSVQEFLKETEKYKDMREELKNYYATLEKYFYDLFEKKDLNLIFCDKELFKYLSILSF